MILVSGDLKGKQSGLLKGTDDYLQEIKDSEIDQGNLGKRSKKNSMPKSPKEKVGGCSC